MTVVPLGPKTEAVSIGPHRLVMRYQPNAVEHERWRWVLTLVKTFEITGKSANTNECKDAAKRAVLTLTGSAS